ncbi:ectonucleoside triphosphate diphosphohydrolase 2-like protein [Labeo rohita]|uniref:Ectonucleoside triphosphate diphosphohydrolase 2-like protein n=1 Tax=Labeo rohita TaxID=84645 RepID=A0A498LZ30_LABRO|nr:ectonucleoside triphosphate diphosphohydrolase 2-like protein [Labeo rohita]
MGKQQQCQIITATAALFLAVIGILLLVVPTEDVKEPPEFMYGIVLDAGSSHTAMFIYKWPADKQNGTGIVSQHSECEAEGGGISSYAGNTGGAARSLEKCMDKAMQEIPKSRHKLTPLYLGATAGMRLLNISKPEESDEVLKEVADKLKTYPFSFKGATILSGQEEGAYGWVTVNYLLENYIKYGFVGQWLSPGRDTVGALDFGGASTQITFETKQTVENKDNLMKLRLYGRDYKIYTQSFLCYGRDQTQGSDHSIVHPCYPAGYSASIKLSSVFDTPCNKRQTPYKPDDDLQIKGTGNYDQCLGNVSRLFSFDSCSYSRCSFDGVFQPNVTGNFMAFSAFFYTHSFLQEATGIRITSPEHLEDAARAVCNMSFQEISNKFQNQESRLKDYCAVSAFVKVLLVSGYGFDYFSFPHVFFQKKYGIVLDAGSSHTSMFIYKWPADKQNGTGIVSQHSECHVKGGGISSYAGNKGGAARSLEECMEKAIQEIPKSRHKLTPLYLGATGGMRLLNISKPKESDEVLKEVADKLKTYPFSFKGATILSGQEEGAYGWVTVNYLLEKFIKYSFVGQWLSPGKDTAGALDLGGASTQITFETAPTVGNKDSLMKLRLYGRDYQIYTQSFLCFGRQQVLLRLLALLMTTQGSDRSIVHPCYPADYSDSIKLSSVFDTPCNKRQTPYKPDDNLQIKGTGNYNQCLGNISRLFSFDNCSYSRCSFDGVFQPSVTGNFMAFSAFFYTHSFLQKAAGITITSPADLEDAVRVVCNMSFQEMQNKFPDEGDHLRDYCADSILLQVLLIKGYGFSDLSFPHISFQEKAEDNSVGWSLGYMLRLSNLLPAENVLVRKTLRPDAWRAAVFLFSGFLIVSVFFLLRNYQKNATKLCF